MAKKEDVFNRDHDALKLTGNEALDPLRLSGEMLSIAGVAPSWAKDSIAQWKKEITEDKNISNVRGFEEYVVHTLSQTTQPGPHLYRPFEGATWYETMTGRSVW
eukprot:CAMPEP_0197874946 /NCGR_PEP_ID=MMETSP1439-20131203/4324_1 /TAXON_ID=66791 /ORGANISM="Gonyaulax spinifera, Strain CCMP409" /LENGTH=103 /DNA_ID=CAMNT_0043494117 /DNA_START=78 /DNA_END=389 /DNA_ORIENTATION=-